MSFLYIYVGTFYIYFHYTYVNVRWGRVSRRGGFRGYVYEVQNR